MSRPSVSKWILSAFALATFAAPAFAADDKANIPVSVSSIDARTIEITRRNDLGVHWFFQNTQAVTPNGGSGSINSFDADVIGIGASYRRGLGQTNNWYVQIDGGYAIGSEKRVVDSPPFSFIDEVKVNTIYGQAQFGYQHKIGGAVTVFAGGGPKYASTGAKFDNGTTVVESERYSGYGLTKSFGGQLDLNDKLAIRGEHYSSFLWNSAKDAGAEYRQTFKEGCYRGTLVFGF